MVTSEHDELFDRGCLGRHLMILLCPQYPERPLDRDSPPNRCIHEIFLEKRTTFSVQRHSEVRHYPTQTIVLLSRPSLAYLSPLSISRSVSSLNTSSKSWKPYLMTRSKSCVVGYPAARFLRRWKLRWMSYCLCIGCSWRRMLPVACE